MQLHAFILYVCVKITKSPQHIFASSMGPIFLLKIPQKLRSKIILESQNIGYDVVEATQEVLVLAMVEQLEKNEASFLQEEHALDNPTR